MIMIAPTAAVDAFAAEILHAYTERLKQRLHGRARMNHRTVSMHVCEDITERARVRETAYAQALDDVDSVLAEFVK